MLQPSPVLLTSAISVGQPLARHITENEVFPPFGFFVLKAFVSPRQNTQPEFSEHSFEYTFPDRTLNILKLTTFRWCSSSACLLLQVCFSL